MIGDPAVSFSIKRSIPSRPNAGVALKHPLFPSEDRISFTNGDDVEHGQQFLLELVRGDAIRIVRRRPKGDREITKCNIEE